MDAQKSIEVEINGARQHIPIDPGFDTSNKKIGASEIFSQISEWLSSKIGLDNGAINLGNLLNLEHPLGFTFIVGKFCTLAWIGIEQFYLIAISYH
jgi:hypothetical protein